MELEMYEKVRGDDYIPLAIIDTFESLVVNKRFSKANDFELKVPLDIETVQMYKTGNALLIDDIFYFIDEVRVPDLDDGLLEVSGRSFFSLLSHRIIWENYSRQTAPEIIAEDLIKRHAENPSNTNRKLPQLKMKAQERLGTESVHYVNSYGTVEDAVEELCELGELGFTEFADGIKSPNAIIEFVKGRDVSDVVEFTSDFENVLSESYEQTSFDEKTIALVAGEGEGSVRKLETVGRGAGADRKELYVDARDLQSENDGKTMTDYQYRQALIARGRQKLAEHQSTLVLDGEINPLNQLFEYGVDYKLGDTVKRSNAALGLSYSAQITEIQEIYENGLEIIPAFGKRSPTLIDLINRK